MKNFTYAHKDTGEGERITRTSSFNKPRISAELQALREGAFKEEIPVSDDETLCFLCTLIRAVKPENILELGTAVGISGVAMLTECESARLTTIERDENFYKSALANFKKFNLSDRVRALAGDAGEIIGSLEENAFDFIFLDCAKVQYIKFLPRLKRLLKRGGVLLADDVLLFGYLTGECEVPKKRKMLVEHIREYLDAVTHDDGFSTTVLDIGNGIALSVKK